MYTNYSWITERLAVGGIVEQAEELPFDAILSLEIFAPLAIAPLVRSGRVVYAWEPIFDAVARPQAEMVRQFDAAADQLDAWLRAGKRALVHCYAGVSRSVSAATWYLMRAYGLTWDQAFARVQAHRRGAFPDIRYEIPLRLAAGEPPDGPWLAERLTDFCWAHDAETGRTLDIAALVAELAHCGLPVPDRAAISTARAKSSDATHGEPEGRLP